MTPEDLVELDPLRLTVKNCVVGSSDKTRANGHVTVGISYTYNVASRIQCPWTFYRADRTTRVHVGPHDIMRIDDLWLQDAYGTQLVQGRYRRGQDIPELHWALDELLNSRVFEMVHDEIIACLNCIGRE